MNIFNKNHLIFFLSLLMSTSSFAMYEDDDKYIRFNYQKSSYKIKAGRSSGAIKKPFIAERDLLSFNIVKFATEGADEESTGFLAWSQYELEEPIQVIKHYYSNERRSEKREPLLVVSKHSVQSGENKTINAFNMQFYYIDAKANKFILLNCNLQNKESKVCWDIGERDIATLPVGKLLQKGKEYLDSDLKSEHYPFFKALDKDDCLLEKKFKKSVGCLSDIIMFGYPYGLSANNGLPLARFGHCSTDPKQSIFSESKERDVDYYVDMASIKGSSGSPLWFTFKELTGTLSNNSVTIEAELDDDEVTHSGEDFSLCSKEITAEGTLDDDTVEIEEKPVYKFAGMLFGGPEKESGNVQDIHLGMALNTHNVLSSLKEVKNTHKIYENPQYNYDSLYKASNLHYSKKNNPIRMPFITAADTIKEPSSITPVCSLPLTNSDYTKDANTASQFPRDLAKENSSVAEENIESENQDLKKEYVINLLADRLKMLCSFKKINSQQNAIEFNDYKSRLLKNEIALASKADSEILNKVFVQNYDVENMQDNHIISIASFLRKEFLDEKEVTKKLDALIETLTQKNEIVLESTPSLKSDNIAQTLII